MDGRRIVAALSVVLATSIGCGGGLRGREDVRAVDVLPVEVDRPALDEIYRNGRYRFSLAPARLQRLMERRFARDEVADAVVETLSVHQVVDTRSPDATMIALGLELEDRAVRDPATWDGFKLGLGEGATSDPIEGTIDGVETFHAEFRGEQAYALHYAPDLIISISAVPSVPQSDLEDLAEYLLEARD